MATLVLQYAGAALGGVIGGPVGAVIGRAAGAIAGSLVDEALFAAPARRRRGPRLDDLKVMGSTEGAAIPRLYGRMRVAGQVVWATPLEEVVSTRTDKASAKGAGSGPKVKTTEYSYYANFAVALCEGEIASIGRVWADGKPFDIAGVTARLHPGSETQEPDSLIAAKEGPDNAPAYRGIAYIVFERLALARFGNRLPQLSFEAVRNIGGASELVRAVNIIPGATEFGYDTALVSRNAGQGVAAPENTHVSAYRSDWSVSLDDLQGACANIGAAALVAAWFGDDLRCAACSLRPKVEAAARATHGADWRVAGLARADAAVMTSAGGHAAYGGTPSDESVLHAIADLKARGPEVTFNPFVLMDIAAGNALIDPYTDEAGQPAYPWRGRITCAPAPGRPGTADKTTAAAAQIASFVGMAAAADFAIAGGAIVYSGPAEWSLRRMVLHYAHLCQLAGGVDAFMIGSELRGLTTLSDGTGAYPFVAALVALAADVAAILPDAKISYAADWSEYFGHQPQDGTGDVHFHLDPLWASPHVAFVGIDNYLPLSDWRDGDQHTDRLAGATSVYDVDYLRRRIAGGEGFDWYYASGADRQAQTRTAITDGAYGKPWVFRPKDLVAWWSNPHHDRPGGIESAVATAWAPRAKPIRFTEIGCASVDKGANQPNVFYDPKSSESALPFFSSGRRDDFMLHRFIEAVLGYWGETGAHNPVSAIYGGPMVEAAGIHLWAWDARPYPAFPMLADVWADGGNYARGHWLNGRIGEVALARLIAALAGEYGIEDVDAAELEGVIDGFLLDHVMSMRDALEPLAQAFAFDAVETGGVLKFRRRTNAPVAALDQSGLAIAKEGGEPFRLTRAEEAALPQVLKVAYIASDLDYRRSAVEAQRLTGASRRETGIEIAAAISQEIAGERAGVMLAEAWSARETADFALPPSRLALEPGDVVALTLNGRAHEMRLEELTDGPWREAKARAHDAAIYDPPDAPARVGELAVPPVFGPPLALVMDLPLAGDGMVAQAPWIAAAARPWPGRLLLLEKTGAAAFTLNRAIEAGAAIGALIDPLPAGPAGLYDRASGARVLMDFGALASVSEAELLAGANIAAVGSETDGWEILQFRDAGLIAERTWQIGWLLRGQRGTAGAAHAAGSLLVMIDGALVQADLRLADVGKTKVWRIGPEGRDHGDPAYVEIAKVATGLGLRPFAPVHARAWREGADVMLSWVRRARIDGDSWELADVPLGEEGERYALDILDGGTARRSVIVASPDYRYTEDQQLADFGAAVSELGVRIAQMSVSYGRGAALEATLRP